MPTNNQPKSLVRTIAEGSTWLTLSTLLTKVLGVATTLLVLASLTVFEYGTSKLVLSIVTFFALFSLPGLAAIVVADMSIEKGKGRYSTARALLRQYLGYKAVLGLLAFPLLFFGAELVAEYLHNEYVAKLVRLLSFVFLVGPFRSAAMVLLRVQYKFGIQSLHQAFEGVIKLFLTYYTLVVLELNVYGVILTYVLTDFLGILPFIPVVAQVYRRFAATPDTSDGSPLSLWTCLRAHGKWAVVQSYLHGLVQSGRLWIIKVVLGTEAVGLYSAAYGMYQHVAGSVPLKNVLASIIPQHNPASETFRKLIVKGVKYSVAGTLALTTVAAVGVPVLIHVLLPQYMDAIMLFELMLLGMIPSSASGVFSVVFFALRQQRNMFWVNVVLSAATFVLLPVLLLTFGIYGAAVELAAIATLFTWERYRRVRMVLPNVALPWKSFFTFDEFDRKIIQRISEKVPLLRTIVK